MAFFDCDEPSDPCLIKLKSMMNAIEVMSSLSSILLNSNKSYNLEILKLSLNTSFDEMKAMFCKCGTISRMALNWIKKLTF